MTHYSIVGVFCEDIREEKYDLLTLVGILPDNVFANRMPLTFGKLGIYLRLHWPASDDPPKNVTMSFVGEGEPRSLGIIEPSIIEKSAKEAKETNAPNCGVVTHVIFSPVVVQKYSRINVMMEIDGEKFVAATLNIREPKTK